MKNRQIWIFKEGRSGSTWFCNTLSKKIGRYSIHFEKHFNLKYHETGEETFKNYAGQLKDLGAIYATHYLHLLTYSSILDSDTFLIRTTRRNKADHCMSKLAYQMFPTKPKHNFVDKEKYNITTYDYKPIVILKHQIKKSMEMLKKHEDYWNIYAKNFDNQIIAYEDLYEGVTIPHLDISIKFSDDETFMKKLPYEKSKIFANYDQIVEWCEFYQKEMGFTKI